MKRLLLSLALLASVFGLNIFPSEASSEGDSKKIAQNKRIKMGPVFFALEENSNEQFLKFYKKQINDPNALVLRDDALASQGGTFYIETEGALLPCIVACNYIQKENRTAVVKQLLNEGADVNGKFGDKTALMWVMRWYYPIEAGGVEMATLLLEHRADTACVDKQGKTALDLISAKIVSAQKVLINLGGSKVDMSEAQQRQKSLIQSFTAIENMLKPSNSERSETAGPGSK